MELVWLSWLASDQWLHLSISPSRLCPLVTPTLRGWQGLPCGLVVKTSSPFNVGSAGSIPDWGAKIAHALVPKNWNTKHGQYCKKFNKDFKKWSTHKKKFYIKKKSFMKKGWHHVVGHFPGGASSKEPTCQCRRCKRHEFDPWIGKIPWRRVVANHSSIPAWKIPWLEDPGGLQRGPWGHKDMGCVEGRYRSCLFSTTLWLCDLRKLLTLAGEKLL